MSNETIRCLIFTMALLQTMRFPETPKENALFVPIAILSVS